MVVYSLGSQKPCLQLVEELNIKLWSPTTRVFTLRKSGGTQMSRLNVPQATAMPLGTSSVL